MKKILLVTRPIAPPWDEASKNFAYFLAQNIPSVQFGFLVNKPLPDLSKNIIQHPIYSSNTLDFFQKIKLIKIRKLLQEEKYDAVHFMLTPNYLNSFFFQYLLKSSAKTIQTVATLREDLYSDQKLKKLFFSDLVVTYSDYAKNKLNLLGVEKVARIYPGIDLEKYRRREKNPLLMEKYAFKKDDFIVNFTGEYVRLNAIDSVINVFIRFSKMIPQAKLSLAVRIKNQKDARKKEQVIKKLKESNLLERVAFHDDGSHQMEDIYNLCDLSLFPVENMRGKFDIPLAVVEAFASEKPVVISDLPVLSELTNGRNSVIIPRGDEGALFEAIMDLYQNPEKRSLLGQEARKFAEERFDIKKVAEEYQKIYTSF